MIKLHKELCSLIFIAKFIRHLAMLVLPIDFAMRKLTYYEVILMKKTVKGSKWFLILATVLCLILLVISVLTFIQSRSAFSVFAIIIVLGVLLMNFIYFKQENK